MLKPFAFSKPPYYQHIKGKSFYPFQKLTPLQPEKLKWPNRLSIVAVLSWVGGILANSADYPTYFILGLLGFFIFASPAFYILLRRTAIDPDKPPH